MKSGMDSNREAYPPAAETGAARRYRRRTERKGPWGVETPCTTAVTVASPSGRVRRQAYRELVQTRAAGDAPAVEHVFGWNGDAAEGKRNRVGEVDRGSRNFTRCQRRLGGAEAGSEQGDEFARLGRRERRPPLRRSDQAEAAAVQGDDRVASVEVVAIVEKRGRDRADGNGCRCAAPLACRPAAADNDRRCLPPPSPSGRAEPGR